MSTKIPSIYPMLDHDELQAAIRRAHHERSKALRSFVAAAVPVAKNAQRTHRSASRQHPRRNLRLSSTEHSRPQLRAANYRR